MPKIRWDKADEYQPDPGAVVEVPDTTRPYVHVSDQEKARHRAEKTKEAQERGEAIRRAEHEGRMEEARKRGVPRVNLFARTVVEEKPAT